MPSRGDRYQEAISTYGTVEISQANDPEGTMERLEIAARCLPGLIAKNPHRNTKFTDEHVTQAAEDALRFADALLEEHERTKPPARSGGC